MNRKRNEICLHFADQNLADLVCFQYEKSSGGPYQIKEFKRGVVQSKFSNNPLEFAFQKGDFRISLAAWNKFYKTSTIRNIPFIKGIYYEDGPHTYALLAKHVKTVVIDAKLYFYTQNMSSISNRFETNPSALESVELGIHGVGTFPSSNLIILIEIVPVPFAASLLS